MSDFLKTAFDYKSMQLKCLYRNEDIALVQTGIEDEHFRTLLRDPLSQAKIIWQRKAVLRTGIR